MKREASGKAFDRVRPVLMGLWGASLSASASAQLPPTAPRPPTREEVERPAQREVDRRPRLTVESGIERAPCALDDVAYRDIRFTLRNISFGGLGPVAEETLRPAYEPFVGQELALAAICEIRDRAATILRDAGYIAAVEIPEQRLTEGRLRLEVLIAKLTAIQVRGDAGRSERTIARYLEKLTGQDAFNRYEAERYLLLARDIPGFDVRLTLRSAGAARGELLGEVTVLRRPGEIDVNVQNYGSRDLGRFGGLVRGQLFGLTGLADRTSLAFFATADPSEQRTVQLGHDFRIGGEGLALGGQLTYAWARPDLADAALDVRARTLLATFEASYPLLRSQAASLRGRVGLDLVDQKVGINGLPLSRDRLRVAFAKIDFDRSDRASFGRLPGYSGAEPRWRYGARFELRQGLGLFGASEGCGPAFARCLAPGAVPPSRLEGEAGATVLRFEGLAELRPIGRLTLALGGRAQWAGEPLLSFEEFAAGNYTVGRGYDPGTLLGDRGAGIQAELRFGSAIASGPKARALQPFLFFDAARIANADRAVPVVGPRSLASAGGGIRAALGDHARLEALVAVPLKRAGLQTERGDPRILVSLTTRLWPWSF